jgi:hypothetical protein
MKGEWQYSSAGLQPAYCCCGAAPQARVMRAFSAQMYWALLRMATTKTKDKYGDSDSSSQNDDVVGGDEVVVGMAGGMTAG